jgi:hypothetical protein
MTRPFRLALAALLAAVLCLAVSGPAGAAAAPKRVPFMRAVTLAAWGPTAYEPRSVKRTLQTLKKRQHVDAVTILVVWSQKNGKSVTVERGAATAPDKNVQGAIRAAKRLHLRVVLRPYVDPADGSWRGDIAPVSLQAWFASYGRFIRHYATLARVEHVDGFVVGSEMETIGGAIANWRALVAEVRRRFAGFVTYQVNWGGDHAINWWDAVDAISISAYYPVAAAPGADVTQLEGGWYKLIDQFGVEHDWFGLIDGLRTMWQRPVMFGEIGYRPVPGAAVEPWNTELKGTDRHAQATAYEAALRVWYRVPWFRGMHWWYVAPDDAMIDGQAGADHRAGADALRVLRRWYAKPR